MTKEQQIAFTNGQTAFVSGCPFTPAHDERMHRSVSESNRQSESHQNQENVRAWYIGYLTQAASGGNGISPELFVSALNVLLDSDSQATSMWITFANECVDSSQFVDFAEDMDNRSSAVNRWLETIVAGMLKVQEQHGTAIATQVCNLALVPCCPYPSEMPQAAEYLKNGGVPAEMWKLIETGELDGIDSFFPKFTQPESEKGYVIATCDDSDFYIPNAEHIERNDNLIPWAFPDDAAAAKGAEADGVRLIYGRDGVEDGIYIDSPENHSIITKMLEQYPQYRHENVQTDPSFDMTLEMECTANRDRIASDMPKCINTFLDIEKTLQIKEQKIGEWMQLVFEINADFDQAPAEVAEQIGNAFLQIKRLNGMDIAQLLYDTQVIVLPSELTASADYLSKGGQFDSLHDLASAGFFMGDFASVTHDDIVRVVSYMNAGGTADAAYKVLEAQGNESDQQQELGMTQQMG